MNDGNLDKERRRLLQALVSAGLIAGLDTLLPTYARAGNSNGRVPMAGWVPGGSARDVVMDLHIRRKVVDIAGGRASAIPAKERGVR